MFSKKEKPRRQNRPPGSLAQYGIFEVPESLGDIGADFAGNDDNDDDLEAELAALTAGDETSRRNKRNSRKPIPQENLDAMVAASMKDVNSDEEASDGDDDPDLLSELKMITGDESPEEKPTPDNETKNASVPNEEIIRLLQERLTLYQIAESKAKRENEPGKARRYNRGVKTLHELLKHAQAGESVNEGDIPPSLPPSATAEKEEKPAEDSTTPAEVNTPLAPMPESPPKDGPTKTVDQEMLQLLKNRQQEYKIAAVAWKRAGNMQQALECIKIAKQFDAAIEAINAGEVLDLSDMPPSPSTPSSAAAPITTPEKTENETQQHSAAEPTSDEEAKPCGLENVEMALKERLEVYKRSKTAAETEGNSSKARRYGRICKQFEDALKLYARGKPVPLDELPTPPGYPPLSVPPPTNVSPSDAGADDKGVTPVPEDVAEPERSEDNVAADPKVPTPPPRTRIGERKPASKIRSRAEEQTILLQKRQHELKQAALAAKTDGDIELARNYLRQAKGIDPLIQASQGGLPVDMNSIPLSPIAKMELSAHAHKNQNSDNFTLISADECTEEASGTDEEIYDNLESQLNKQIQWCLDTRDHSKALGDVSAYNRWERLALSYKRDLDMLRVRKRDSLPPPLHHYETKTYAIVQSCTDLTDADVEISIIRGINYSKETDTYVMFEFPYPSDNAPSDRTSTIRGSNNPEYQAVFPLNGILERTSRQCQRAFKRHALKCQVWAKGPLFCWFYYFCTFILMLAVILARVHITRCSWNPILCCTHPRGFFRSDSLLGTVTVKLQPLETQCTLHDSFPLMDGRKATGGKLELKIRLRNPISTKQIEQMTHKWLTIDQ